MVSGAGRRRLDRRRLMVGAMAGTAGLLLPREAMAGLRLIHVRVHNVAWGDSLDLHFWKTGDPDGPTETWHLNQGHEKEFKSERRASDAVWNACMLTIGSIITHIDFFNP